jgi:hypothetical protein
MRGVDCRWLLGGEEGLESTELVVVEVAVEEVWVVVVVMVAGLCLVHPAPAVSVYCAGSRLLTCSQMEAFKQQASC